MAKAQIQNLAAFDRDLKSAVSGKRILRKFRETYGKRVVEALIRAAAAGIGPGGAPYPPYEDSYKKALGLAGTFSKKASSAFLATGKGGKARFSRATGAGNKQWLVGVGSAAGKSGMLAETNFKWQEPTEQYLTLKWTGQGQQAIYGPVHQEGKPLGRGGPQKKREWMHFNSPGTEAVVWKALQAAQDDLTAQFSARWG